MSDKLPITQHPLDWQTAKKTPQPIYNLAIAAAWHKRLAAPGYLPDDPSFVYDGPIVDPAGRDTQPMTEEVYDAMIADAQHLLQSCREAAQKLMPPVAAKFVRIISHSSLNYAVVVRAPNRLSATQLLQKISDANNMTERFASASFEMSESMLWPPAGSVEKDDLINSLPLAFQMDLPECFLGLTGITGAKVKHPA